MSSSRIGGKRRLLSRMAACWRGALSSATRLPEQRIICHVDGGGTQEAPGMNRGPRGQITASPVLIGEALLYWSIYYRQVRYAGISMSGSKAGVQAAAQ